jgi:hypothetical protein
MHAFSQAALKFARIDLWGRSEPGNTHLILIERERRAGILTPPGRVILRQCSSRRGKHSMRGLVQLSRQRGEAVPLRSLYHPGLDLQLTSRRAVRRARLQTGPHGPLGARRRSTVASATVGARHRELTGSRERPSPQAWPTARRGAGSGTGRRPGAAGTGRPEPAAAPDFPQQPRHAIVDRDTEVQGSPHGTHDRRRSDR